MDLQMKKRIQMEAHTFVIYIMLSGSEAIANLDLIPHTELLISFLWSLYGIH